MLLRTDEAPSPRPSRAPVYSTFCSMHLPEKDEKTKRLESFTMPQPIPCSLMRRVLWVLWACGCGCSLPRSAASPQRFPANSMEDHHHTTPAQIHSRVCELCNTAYIPRTVLQAPDWLQLAGGLYSRVKKKKNDDKVVTNYFTAPSNLDPS